MSPVQNPGLTIQRHPKTEITHNLWFDIFWRQLYFRWPHTCTYGFHPLNFRPTVESISRCLGFIEWLSL